MANAKELAARAARIGQNRQPTAPAADDAAGERPQPSAKATTKTPATRTKPVRITVDLMPQDHAKLSARTAEIGQQIGRVRLPAAEVVRALVAELEADPSLRDRVAGRITQ